MASNIEMDLMLKRAVRLLHSTSTNSATELRQMLDEVLKQRFGAEHMLCKTLTKKQLEEEKNFPGRVPTPPPQIMPQEDEVINLASPTKPSNSPETLVDSDEGANSNNTRMPTAAVPSILAAADEDINLKEFGDLNCCECGSMMFTATNRLIECSKCGALYHQECHKPPISDEDASEDREQQWVCRNCDKSSSSKASSTKSSEVVVISDEASSPVKSVSKNKSTSSSSSNSSSPFHKNEPSSSKQRTQREDRGSTKNSSSNIVTPAINLLSAPDRSSTHTKRTQHSQNSSTAKSSRTRHGDTSSNKKRSGK